MIRLENVYKSFGEARVLGGVDLQAEKNEFIVLVGPGRCGKTARWNARTPAGAWCIRRRFCSPG